MDLKLQEERELLCKESIEIAGSIKTSEWIEEDVTNVIKYLERKKSLEIHMVIQMK